MKLPLWRRRREEELEEEIQSHLQMAIRDRMGRGESAEKAESAARREFGNVGLIKETTRGMWGWAEAKLIFDDMRDGLRSCAPSWRWGSGLPRRYSVWHTAFCCAHYRIPTRSASWRSITPIQLR